MIGRQWRPEYGFNSGRCFLLHNRIDPGEKMGNKIRMKDIAQQAGVSTVTVSKALAGMHGVSERKRREIMTIAEEMGYIPPEKGQAEDALGYRIHVIMEERFYGQTPMLYDHMMELLSDEVFRAGCRITSDFVTGGIAPDLPDLALSQRLVRPWQGSSMNGADGLIILGELDPESLVNLPGTSEKPSIFIDSNPPMGNDCVISDSFHGAYQLTNYLLDRGHAKIAFVGTLLAAGCITERYLGYTRAMMEHNLKAWQIDDRDLYTGTLRDDTSLRIPEEMPDAFFCNSDRTAAILFEKLRKMEIHCPEDVSIVGFDNIPYPNISPKRFTTYEIDQQKMAYEAIRILLRRIRGDPFRRRIHIISGRIVEGESVRTKAHSSEPGIYGR